jgi:hypothetical protein
MDEQSLPRPGDGGAVVIRGGDGGPNGPGAPIFITGGMATPHGPGAPVNITGGAGGSLVIQTPAPAPATANTAPDESSWVLISKLQPARIENIRERKRFLARHPEIRTRRPSTKEGKPNPKRMEVHIGDWVKYWDRVDNQTFDNLDSAAPAPITPDELAEDCFDGAVALYKKIYQGKGPRK